MRDINRRSDNQVLLLSLYFFLYFSGVGFIQPFITLHFHNIGMTGLQIGSITTISGLLALVAAPVLGAVYDLTKRKRLFFQIVLFLSGIFLLLVGQMKSFWAILMFYSIYRFCGASNVPTAENLSYSIALAGTGKRSRFGFMRLWGSIGFSITAVVGGRIVEQANIQYNFFLFLICIFLVVVVVSRISSQAFNHTDEAVTTQPKANTGSVVKLIVSDKYLMLMILALAITHPMGNGLRQFEPIYMSQLGLTESLIGLAATLSALFEVPFMLWADNWIKKLGITPILLFIFWFDLLRRLLVWFFPSGEMVFTTHVATSFSFSLRLVIAVSMINTRVPKKFTTTALALVTMTIFGVANMISSAISGIIFDTFGGRELYLLSAAGCILSILFGFLASIFEKKQFMKRA